ncbi:MAG TPA: succinate dehydrogenase/fumarate reductase iron-sulfur subunit [Methanobacterium sp.]|jgi:fumarate reductase (CoM/CoB) subunit B|nr:MAG: succinate dehydrogenase/fumarate reductase iron-sulfur subunit [Methanobacterium sp.]HOI70740.1 succinate dehydrogenase/fumarate reductase iron-sulfur subunit [Methanobacterium sp.]
MIEVKVSRYDPRKDVSPHLETYKINKKEKMKVLDALNSINEEYDAQISYRCSCRAGQCGSCAVKVNGETVLACKAEIEDGDLIEPLDFDVIKDLVVDRIPIDSRVKDLNLYIDDCNVYTCPAVINPDELENSRKLRSCIECLSCLSSCPVLSETDEFAGPYFMRYLSKFAMDPRDCADRAQTGFDEGLYCCTSCGKCVEVCPKEINTFGGAIEKLREISCQEGIGPLPPQKAVKKLIKETGRSVEAPGEGEMGAGLIKYLSEHSEPTTDVKNKPKIAFFTGCMIDYRLPEVGLALIDLLKKQGIDVIVPTDQVCCASPMIRTGQTDIVEEMVRKNAKVFKDYDIILTVCAGCGATLKNDYPQYGVNLNVMEISEFLLDKLNTEDMEPLNMRVTYHDPCHLSRGQGIRESPREILGKIKGLEFVEMEEPNRCCGSGGGVRAGKPELAEKMGKRKAEMIKETGADAVITICPFCEYHIRDSLEKEGMDVEVLNILKLLQMAYGKVN